MKIRLGLLALLAPSVFVLVLTAARNAYWNVGNMYFHVNEGVIWLIVDIFWAFTIWGLTLYVRHVPFRHWLLPASFAICPLASFVYGAAPGYLTSSFHLSDAVFATGVYALPFFLASVIIAVQLSKQRAVILWNFRFLALLLPSLFVAAAMSTGSGDGAAGLILIAASYLLTILGMGIYVKYAPFSPWLLLASFGFCWLPAYFYETAHRGFLQYLATFLIALFYALPFFIASIVIAVIMHERKNGGGGN